MNLDIFGFRSADSFGFKIDKMLGMLKVYSNLAPPKECDGGWRNAHAPEFPYIHLNLQVNINFYDSSLWHRFNTFLRCSRKRFRLGNFRAMDREKNDDDDLGYCDVVQEILQDSVALAEETSTGRNSSKLLSPFCSVSKITENLLLASAAAADVDTLKHFNVTCVINSAAELPDLPLASNFINYHKVVIHDLPSVDIISCFDSTLDIMHKEISNGGTVLVHCVAGISRSATICMAYLMKMHKMSLLQAYNHVKLKRPVVKPNCGFFRQLIHFEKMLYGQCSVCMIHNETVNMEIPDVYNCDYKNITNYRRKRRDPVRRH